MKKISLITIVGTRPEIIRLSRVIYKLDNCESINHIFVHTGQNYDFELNQIFFDELNIRKPDYFLDAAGSNSIQTIANILIKFDKLIEELNPNAILVLGDTNSAMCTIAAKKKHIPIFHMEAGNRCYDQRVPEETNRKIVDHISDINLTYSSIAREYLLREGIPADKIIKTGSPMFEVLNYYLPTILNSKILNKLNLIKHKYFLVSCHREENINIDFNFENFIFSINKIAESYNLPIIVSTHPRTRNMIELKSIKLHKNIQLIKPLGFLDYNYLQINSKAVLSDSGTISEESSILNFPALNIRQSHERPEAMEETSVMMVGLNYETILQGLHVIENQGRDNIRTLNLVNDYSTPNVSEKIVRIIISHVHYIKRTVWNE
jgi:UDP-N-acetylglucosamine 2-epimerase